MTEAEWAERASRYLKAELKRAAIKYGGLANLLKKQGFKNETKATVSSKLASGTFTPGFFLASLVAIGCEAISWRKFKTHQKLAPYPASATETKGHVCYLLPSNAKYVAHLPRVENWERR